MRVLAIMALMVVSALGLHAAAGAGTAQSERKARDNVEGFEAQIREIKGKARQRMTGVSWHQGCPVALDHLRLIRTTFWDFDSERETGSIVVHENEAAEIVRVFRSLYRHRFKIRRMQLIDRYDGSDHASMDADNSSGFNCRYITGTTTWSQHAFGRAIDINPIENPYVTPSGHVSPPAGALYADRSRDDKGMIHRGDHAYRAFAQEDWKWGGNWSGTKDYQHFSRNGR
ncbi:MAG: M15 family metallopeptidase [Actinomycetota bacterium]|nr:M15 family metallopeptidase [Actinomycetota bacterium]